VVQKHGDEYDDDHDDDHHADDGAPPPTIVPPPPPSKPFVLAPAPKTLGSRRGQGQSQGQGESVPSATGDSTAGGEGEGGGRKVVARQESEPAEKGAVVLLGGVDTDAGVEVEATETSTNHQGPDGASSGFLASTLTWLPLVGSRPSTPTTPTAPALEIVPTHAPHQEM
jgi:hypothetical protein